jgi:hypothetical protein
MGPGCVNGRRGGANSEYMLDGAEAPIRAASPIRGTGGSGSSLECPANSELSDLEEDCDLKGAPYGSPGEGRRGSWP